MDQTQKQVQTIKVEGGIQAVGPFTAGKVVSSRANLVFTSGNLGLNPETQALVSEEVGEQARQALLNIGQVLKAANSGYESIIKVTVYLVDMADFARVNEEYAKIMSSDFPARSCIAVEQLPRNARVEIEVIAFQNP